MFVVMPAGNTAVAYLFDKSAPPIPESQLSLRLLGDAAQHLKGMMQPLEPREAQLLQFGLNPIHAEPLGRRHKNPNLGIRAVLSADKEISLLYARLPRKWRKRLVRIHERAVRYAIDECLARYFAFGRTGKGGVDKVSLAIAYSVRTEVWNRNKEPHLHTEILIFPKGRDAQGNWRSLWTKPFFDSHPRRLVNQAYQAELSRGLLREFGLLTRLHGMSTRLVANSPAAQTTANNARQQTSTRRQQVVSHLKARKLSPTPRNTRRAAFATRPPKPNIDHEQQIRWWQQKLRDWGFTAKAFVRSAQRTWDAAHQTWVARKLTRLAVRELRLKHGRFDEATLRAVVDALRHGTPLKPWAVRRAIARVVANPGRFKLVDITERNGKVTFRCKVQQKVHEKTYLDIGSLARKVVKRQVNSGTVQGAIAIGGHRLSPEAKKVVESVAQSRKRFVTIGQGKELRKVVHALEHAEHLGRRRVIIAAADSRRAERYSSDDRSRIHTIAQLAKSDLVRPGHIRSLASSLFLGKGGLNARLAQAEQRRAAPLRFRKHTTLIIDPRGAMPGDLQKIVRAAKKAGTKVVMLNSDGREIHREVRRVRARQHNRRRGR